MGRSRLNSGTTVSGPLPLKGGPPKNVPSRTGQIQYASSPSTGEANKDRSLPLKERPPKNVPSPLKGWPPKKRSLPFKGRARVGMGLIVKPGPALPSFAG